VQVISSFQRLGFSACAGRDYPQENDKAGFGIKTAS
jgi:hypothetical protein